MTADLAQCLVPVNADIPETDIEFVEKPDYPLNVRGVRGVGEIGITGVAACGGQCRVQRDGPARARSADHAGQDCDWGSIMMGAASTESSADILDVHAHAILPIRRQAAAALQNVTITDASMWGMRLPDWSPEARLGYMDRQGIAACVLSWPDGTTQ